MKLVKMLAVLKEEDHRKALYATLIFIMLNILFFLLVSMEEPDPPLQEEIIPIDMENIEIPEEFMEEAGSGGSSEGGPSQVDEQVHHSAEQTQTQQDPSVHVNAGNENQTENGVNNQPQPDQSLGFNGNEGNDNGTNEGNTFGSENGVGGHDSGPGGDGNYNPNRKITTAPTFNGNAQEEGRIALDLWVDENGNVIQVRYKESKSTSGSEYLISLATRAAKTMKYDKKPGAVKEHVGYQIFEFKKI